MVLPTSGAHSGNEKLPSSDVAISKFALGHIWMPTSHCRPEGIPGGRKELNVSGLPPHNTWISQTCIFRMLCC